MINNIKELIETFFFSHSESWLELKLTIQIKHFRIIRYLNYFVFLSLLFVNKKFVSEIQMFGLPSWANSLDYRNSIFPIRAPAFPSTFPDPMLRLDNTTV